mgnify:FL=1
MNPNNHDRVKQNSKNKLYRDVEKRLMTAFIYALAEYERVFGHLWGEQLAEEAKLTPEQEKFLNMFEEARKNILDNGNKQIRIFEKVLDQYDIEWKGEQRFYINMQNQNPN